MDINKPFTYEQLKEAMDKLKPKEEIHVNQSTHDRIVELLDFEVLNLKVNNFIPDNQVIILDIEKMERDLFKSFGVPKSCFNFDE